MDPPAPTAPEEASAEHGAATLWPAVVVPLGIYYAGVVTVGVVVDAALTLLDEAGIPTPDFGDPRSGGWLHAYGGAVFALAILLLLACVRLRGHAVAPRLLWRRGSLRARWWPLLALGAVGAAYGAGWVVDILFGASLQIEGMTREAAGWGTPAGGGAIALVMGLLSSVVLGPAWEELGFRGFALGRLLRRWPGRRGAWGAIFLSSGVFALPHIEPQHVASAFLMGLYLGVVAWRTGSIVPALICHAAVNASWATMSIAWGWWARSAGVAPTPADGAWAAGEPMPPPMEPWLAWTLWLAAWGWLLVQAAGFVGAIVLLVRTDPPDDADEQWRTPAKSSAGPSLSSSTDAAPARPG